MFKNSVKHLFRTPGKTLLFFLLMAACSLLLVFGSVMLSETEQRIGTVENNFTTIGMVEQDPISLYVPEVVSDDCYGTHTFLEPEYDDTILIDALNFEGAGYVQPPENRPYYAAYLPELEPRPKDQYYHKCYVEFTALEDVTEKGHPAEVRIEKVLSAPPKDSFYWEDGGVPQEGKTYHFCECMLLSTEEPAVPLKAGERYVASLWPFNCPVHQIMEFGLHTAAQSTQCNKDGTRRKSDFFPKDPEGKTSSLRVDPVTEGFWKEGGLGQAWLNDIEADEWSYSLFFVAPTNSLQLIPAFQYQQAYLEQGREITEEEFSSGARVCMVTDSFLTYQGLHIGDKLNLPLVLSIYNYAPDRVVHGDFSGFTALNTQGELYEPFWDEEYEIVGTYSLIEGSATSSGRFPREAFIIPSKSVEASDENNIPWFEAMTPWTATFQIENGTIEEFDAALRENVPEMDSLTVTYNDNGYTDIMRPLQAARTTAVFLFGAGVLAAGAVIALLLFFFIVKQKKRTAVERSLGMTKRQCRVSMVSGVLVLTLLASAVGGVGGGMLLSFSENIPAVEQTAEGEEASAPVSSAPEADSSVEAPSAETAIDGEPEAETIGGFDIKFSLWAKDQERAEQELGALKVQMPAWLYFLVPLVLVAAVFLLSLLLVNRNLRTDPILLLGSKNE